MVDQATGNRTSDWLMVDTGRIDQVKGELSNGHPVVFGMRTNWGFRRLRGNAYGGPDNLGTTTVITL